MRSRPAAESPVLCRSLLKLPPAIITGSFSGGISAIFSENTSAEMSLSDLLMAYLRYQNCQVKLAGVTFETPLTLSSRNGKITQGESSIAAYAQIKNAIEMSGTGDLVCWPTRYNANLQVGCWDNGHFTVR